MYAQAFFLAVFGLAAIGFGVVVFRTSSMMRSALALLFSQTAIGCMFLVMQTEFLGVLQIMMMATEMSIMAIFMVMFMMDPGGMGGMDMSHQKSFSIGAGVVAAGAAIAVALLADWGPVTVGVHSFLNLGPLFDASRVRVRVCACRRIMRACVVRLCAR